MTLRLSTPLAPSNPPSSPSLALDETTRRQRLATDPAGSAWVSANAGSGKTYVLARRVVRLLLAGANPAAILCLTFTKAAAAEMAGRVYGLLAEWVTAPEASLAEAILAVEGTPPQAAKIQLARTLFARALETPGGLKIQTLHAFCERILHQFPLEAGVPTGFEVLDEAGAAKLIRQAEADTLKAATHRQGSALEQAFTVLFETCGDHARDNAVRACLTERESLRAYFDSLGGLDGLKPDLSDRFGVSLDQSEADVLEALPLQGILTEAKARQLSGDLAGGSKTEQKTAARLLAALDARQSGDPVAAFNTYCEIFLTKSGGPRADSSLASKTYLKAHPQLLDIRDAEVDRIMAAKDRRAAHRTASLTLALLTFAADILDRYQRAKRSRSLLDFSDLIAATAQLLASRPSAAWVQYKLDGGIDHILIDEAQDTSPAQWSIINALSAEFFAGDGARKIARTIFAVGDVKQSIYSFQGADPAGFLRQRARFGAAAQAAEAPWNPIELQLSFRSTRDVLGAVDRVFETAEMCQAVAEGDYSPHTANRHADPGKVVIWPMLSQESEAEPEDWTAPVDQVSRQSPEARLAKRIANEVRGWLDGAVRLHGAATPIRAGDVLILVRKRDAFVETLMRTLKAHAIPVAGADRVALAEHIAVKDLIALAEVALLPAQDLSLAALLRGPLFGLGEDALFDLAHRRGDRSLREALRSAATENAHLAKIEHRLARWLGRADTAPPYEFFARLLGPEGGRLLFRARLGSEVDDILDEFLQLTLTYEQSGEALSLQGFVSFFAASAGQIKREAETGANEVRIMTVHGAKGLEAPIVFLVDPGSAPISAQHMPVLRPLPERNAGGRAPSGLFWAQPKPYVTALQDASDTAIVEAAQAEYVRLLYVGMTRARDWLYICGYAGKRGADEACWHAIVTRALRSDCRPEHEVENEAENGPAISSANSPQSQSEGTYLTRADDEDAALIWQVPRKGPGSGASKVLNKPAATAPAPISSADQAVQTAPPSWLSTRPPPPAFPLALAPSGAVGAVLEADEDPVAPSPIAAFEAGARPADAAQRKAAPEKERRTAIQRGRYIHDLLQHLPGHDVVAQDQRFQRLKRLYADPFYAGLSADILQQGYHEVRRILDDPRFAVLFGPYSRAEVDLAGQLVDPKGRLVQLTGRVDRLAFKGKELLLVDFKTGRRPQLTEPAQADAMRADYAQQLALYALVLAGRFPGYQIKAALLWTGEPALQELDTVALTEARAGYQLSA